MIKNEDSKCIGTIEGIIEYKDGSKEIIKFNNTILKTGRSALASCLANKIGNDFDFFINKMVFGDGGSSGSVPKKVNDNRTSLFGSAVIVVPVISNINPDNPTQVIFTSTIKFEDGNGYNLNEMALQMNNGDFYSMATFAGYSKASNMQITWIWRLTFI